MYQFFVEKCLIWGLSFSSLLSPVSDDVGFKRSKDCVTFTSPSKLCNQERKSCKAQHCKGKTEHIQQIYEAVQGEFLLISISKGGFSY